MTVHCSTSDPTLRASGKTVVYVNMFHALNGACGSAWITRQIADQFGKGRIAVVEVEFEPGEGNP
jgi:quercetin dioxygenase-like cupin family protein